MSLRTVVRTFLGLQRLEVFLAVMLPFFLIFESSLANGSVYAGGHLDFLTLNGWIAFGRGLFFEVLTYASARLTKVLLMRSRSWKEGFPAILPAFLSIWCVVVSAGNNLGWVLAGGDFESIFASMGHFMPPSFLFCYQMGLGLLLPLSVGVLALVDVSHLIRAAIEDASLDEDATDVLEAEMHRGAMMREMKKQAKKTQKNYEAIAAKRALEFAKRAETGDLSFSTKNKSRLQTSVTPMQQGVPALGGAPVQSALPPGARQPAQSGPYAQQTQPFAQPFPGQFPPNLQPQGQQGYYRP